MSWAIREGALVARDAANKLATCTFTATATFTDGTTQTKRFVIEPTDSFFDDYLAYSIANARIHRRAQRSDHRR